MALAHRPQADGAAAADPSARADALARLGRAQALQGAIADALLQWRQPTHLYVAVCRVLVELGGLRMAWVGRLAADGLSIQPLAISGHDQGYVQSLALRTDRAAGPGAKALLSGLPQLCQDVAADAAMAPWRERALARGYRSMAVFPVAPAGRVTDCLTVYADRPQGMDADLQRLLARLALQLAHALETDAATRQLHRRQQALADEVGQRTAELARTSERLARQGRCMRAMLALSQRATALSEPRLIAQAAQALAEASGARWLGLVSLDDAGQSALAQAWAGMAAPQDPHAWWQRAWPLAQQLAQGTAQELPQAMADGSADRWVPQDPGRDGPDSAAAAPLGPHAPVPPPGLVWPLAVGADGGPAMQTGLADDGRQDWAESAGLMPVVEQGRVRLLMLVGPGAIADADAAAEWALFAQDAWRIVRRRRTEEALAAALRAAEVAETAKAAFLANIGHEVRTPMNAIAGFAHLLAREPLSTGQQALLRRLDAAGRQLVRVIDDVLDLSHLQVGALPLRPETFGLDGLLDEALAEVGQAALAKQLTLRLSPPPRRWHLLADRHRLRQVLGHLLDNAVKFTAQGEVVLGADVQDGPSVGADAPDPQRMATPANRRGGVTGVNSAQAESHVLRLWVGDTGIGLDGAMSVRAFGAFEQRDASRTRPHGGTGLGLALAQQLVARMGGRLSVESVPDRGSCFQFTLPVPLAWSGSRDGLRKRPAVANPLARGGGVALGRGERAAGAWGDAEAVACGQPTVPQGLDGPAQGLAAAPPRLAGAPARAGLEAVPGLDLAAGLRRLNGQRATYQRVLVLFLSHHRRDSATLRQLATQDAEGDAQLWEPLGALAHALVGAAATLGASELAHAARETLAACTGAQRGAQPHRLRPAALRLAQVLDELVGALEPLLAPAADAPPALGAAPPAVDAARAPVDLAAGRTATPAGDPALHWSQLDELLGLLVRHDTAASDWLDAHADALRTLALAAASGTGALPPSLTVQRLVAQVQGFDFEAAVPMLRSLLAALRPACAVMDRPD